MKDHPSAMYFLTSTAKTARDIAWQVVLLGRHPEISAERHSVESPAVLEYPRGLQTRGSPVATSGQTFRYMLEQPVESKITQL